MHDAARSDPASGPATRWLLGLLALGIAARVLLTAPNPVLNSFDDHYTPVFKTMAHHAPPGPLDCWQCYQPPVMYSVSAVIAQTLRAARFDQQTVMKALQWLNCAFGIGALLILFFWLRESRASAFVRVVAFAFAALLPRHLYMGAMFANDAAASFFIILTAWLCARLLRVPGLGLALGIAAAATAAVFTKYTAFAVLPMIAVTVLLLYRRGVAPRPRTLRPIALVLLLPLVLLAAWMSSNLARYGEALPHNAAIFDPSHGQVRDEPVGMRFTTFEPWRFVAHPLLRPGQVGSFWTLLQAGLYFDDEPRFAILLGDPRPWDRYYGWLRGEAAWPGELAPPIFLDFGRALELLGLAWLALGLTGLWRLLRALPSCAPGDPRLELLPLLTLLLFTFAGVAYLVMKMPVLSAAKSSYLLGAMPAMAGFIALGVDGWSRVRLLKLAAAGVAAAYVALSFAHVVYWAVAQAR